MKFLKLFFVMAFCAIAFNMNAVTKATITITSDAHSDYYDCLEIEMDAAYATDFANSSKKFHSEMSGGTVELYAVGTTQDYCIIKMKDVNGVKLVFKANTADDNYTMSFSNVSENCPIKVKKGTDGTPFEMTANYQFSCTKSTSCEFYLVTPQEVDYTRDVTSGKFGTLCLPWASTALDGAKYYEILGFDAEQGVALQEVSALEAGVPYVFEATAAQIKVTHAVDTAAFVPATSVEGVIGSFVVMDVPQDMYIVYENKLYKTADATNKIGANCAYFNISEMKEYVPVPGAPVRFLGRNIPANVAEVAAPAMMDGKMMINGQLIIMKGGKMFNAQGAAL